MTKFKKMGYMDCQEHGFVKKLAEGEWFCPACCVRDMVLNPPNWQILSLNHFSRKYIEPAMAKLAAQIDADIMKEIGMSETMPGVGSLPLTNSPIKM